MFNSSAESGYHRNENVSSVKYSSGAYQYGVIPHLMLLFVEHVALAK